jgi:hypothetical protein
MADRDRKLSEGKSIDK